MDDHDLNMERASQAGSVSGMEVEDEDSQTLRDADMDMHDIEVESHFADVRHAVTSDEDMTAEILEQEQRRDCVEWKVPDIDLTDAKVDETISDTVASGVASTPSSTERAADVAAVVPNQARDGILASVSTVEQATRTETSLDPSESDFPTAADDSAPVKIASNSSHGDDNSAVPQDHLITERHVQISAVSQLGTAEATYDETDEDYYHERTENHEHINLDTVSRRPVLQTHYLRHVSVVPGGVDAAEQTWAPHCSLIYDNLLYSLFRPSSIPSGDDEEVIFGEDEAEGNNLYYASLIDLMDKLHDVFPDLRGDGENELILDFGALEMRISQDNLYASQLSLHDLDRIRAGMCQPELDRLQINLIVGKRFVQRFNELAEHCYRMYAGSHDENEGAFVSQDTSADAAVPAVADSPPKFVPHTEVSESVAGPAHGGRGVSTEDDDEGEGSADPPPDEHYEDGEFAASNVEADGAAHNGADTDAGHDDQDAYSDENDDDTVQGIEADSAEATEGQGADMARTATEEIEEYIEPVDMTAPVADAVEQAESYDDSVVEAQVETKGTANAIIDGNADLAPGPSVKAPSRTLPEDLEKEYCNRLMSPTKEEIRPSANDTGVSATGIDAYHVEVSSDTQLGRPLPAKRSHDDLAELADSSDSTGASSSSLPKRTKITS